MLSAKKKHDLQTGTVWLKIGPPKKELTSSKNWASQGFPFTDRPFFGTTPPLPWHWDLRFFGLRDVTNSNGH